MEYESQKWTNVSCFTVATVRLILPHPSDEGYKGEEKFYLKVKKGKKYRTSLFKRVTATENLYKCSTFENTSFEDENLYTFQELTSEFGDMYYIADGDKDDVLWVKPQVRIDFLDGRMKNSYYDTVGEAHEAYLKIISHLKTKTTSL